MRKVCLYCERTESDTNLFCQEVYCPAETAPFILDRGDWLGDIEIMRPLSVLRSSTLYEVQQGRRRALLKVAHPGPEHTERLKREALALRELSAGKTPPLGLPRLLPAHPTSSVQQHPYGRAMLEGHLLFFTLFEHFSGATLRDLLIARPQHWIYHVGWVMGGIARAVAVLQSKGLLHYALCPEAVLVRHGEQGEGPRILLFDLGVACTRLELPTAWYPGLVPPAYCAPELIGGGTPTGRYASDVYGLGLMLHELLTGQPAYPHGRLGDGELFEVVRARPNPTSKRGEDVEEVSRLADQAVLQSPDARPQSAAEVAVALQEQFGIPPVKRPIWVPTPRVAIVLVAALLALAFLIAVGVSVAA